LPRFATDRLRKTGAGLPDGGPLVTTARDANRLVLAAVDGRARELGLWPGMPLGQAQAMVPGLSAHPADPGQDVAALRQLTGWCLRYAPLVAVDGTDGIWIDVTGSAHLFGGETRLLRDLLGRFAGQGLTAQAAIAGTPGAARAMARFADAARALGMGSLQPLIIAPGNEVAALAPLPVEALRLPTDVTEDLRRLGFERIGDLTSQPRAPLARRFGALLATRLNQAHGVVFEPITPWLPETLIQAHLAFPEPILTMEALSAAISALTRDVCRTLEQTGQGVRRIDLLFERVDGAIPTLRIGTAHPNRDPSHLSRLLVERLERIDPGLGVEAMNLIVTSAEPLAWVQTQVRLTAARATDRDLAPLVDRLTNRLGSARVYRVRPVETYVPERMAERAEPLATRTRGSPWRSDLSLPIRLLDPPQPIEVMALLPDYPPVAFTWRRVRHRIRHCSGPERIAGEWWRREGEKQALRDYFRVEDEDGRRFWLFRRGDGADSDTGDRCWFLHGFF
jgi:protein ImuB